LESLPGNFPNNGGLNRPFTSVSSLFLSLALSPLTLRLKTRLDASPNTPGTSQETKPNKASEGQQSLSPKNVLFVQQPAYRLSLRVITVQLVLHCNVQHRRILVVFNLPISSRPKKAVRAGIRYGGAPKPRRAHDHSR
jgi:hypothetical protein